MKPDQLMAMTAGRSVDLVGIAQREVPTTVWRDLLKFDGPVPKQTPVYREPEWTPEDAALACAGLDEKYYAAFAFRFAGDDGVRSTLWSALLMYTVGASQRENWPLEVEGVKMLRGIVDLAILEEYLTVRQPAALAEIRSRDLWHAYFGVSVQLLSRIGEGPEAVGQHRPQLPKLGVTVGAWERQIAKPYQAVRDTLERWCGVAYSYASQRLRDDDLDCA